MQSKKNVGDAKRLPCLAYNVAECLIMSVISVQSPHICKVGNVYKNKAKRHDGLSLITLVPH